MVRTSKLKVMDRQQASWGPTVKKARAWESQTQGAGPPLRPRAGSVGREKQQAVPQWELVFLSCPGNSHTETCSSRGKNTSQ